MRFGSVALVVGLWAAAPALAQEVEADPDQELAPEDEGLPSPAPQAVQHARPPLGDVPRRARAVLSDDTPVKLPWSEVARLLE